MIIIFALFVLLFIRIHFSLKDRDEKKRIWFVLFVISFVVFFSLTLLQRDLLFAGYSSGTIGSDPTYYYSESLKLLNGGNYLSHIISDKHAIGYEIWSALILSLSPDENVIWIKICNVLIMLNLLFSLYLLVGRAGFSPRTSLIAMVLVGSCGAIIWTSITNYRDIIIQFLLIESLLVLESFRIWRRPKLFGSFYLAILLYALLKLRIFAMFFVLMLIAYYFLVIVRSKVIKVISIALVLTIGLVAFNTLIGFNRLDSLQKIIGRYSVSNQARPELAAMFGRASMVKRLVIGGVRYVFLPTPMKYLNNILDPQKAIYVSTYHLGFVGSFWEAESSLLWWLLLPLAILAFFNRKYWGNTVLMALFILTILHVLMYGYVWGGETGLRNKIPIFIFGYLLGAIELGNTKKDKLMGLYTLFAIPLFFLSYWWAVGFE